MNAAAELFLSDGYNNVSIRRISETARVSPSNIYNYFKSKDDLFREIVKPAIDDLERIMDEHHGRRGTDIMAMFSENYLRKAVEEYIAVINVHRRQLKLLLLYSQGTSLENYKEDFTCRSTLLIREYLHNMKQKYPDIAINVSGFFISLHTVWMFNLFEELIKNNIKNGDMERIIKEYITFEMTGWRELIKI